MKASVCKRFRIDDDYYTAKIQDVVKKMQEIEKKRKEIMVRAR